MCGELDEGVQINAEIRDRLTIISRKVGVEFAGEPVYPGPMEEDADRAVYMDQLFAKVLTDTLAEVEGAAETEKIDVIASRAIVLARLAGFLAGQLPPDADLFRTVIEAVTEGHAEPRRIAEKLRAQMQDHHHHGHDHGHDHGHGHSHDHGHGHGHGHA